MDMTLNEIVLLTSTRWNEKYQPLTTDMTNSRNQSRYRLRINIILVNDSSPF